MSNKSFGKILAATLAGAVMLATGCGRSEDTGSAENSVGGKNVNSVSSEGTDSNKNANNANAENSDENAENLENTYENTNSDATSDKSSTQNANPIELSEEELSMSVDYTYKDHPVELVDGDVSFGIGNYFTIELEKNIKDKFPKLQEKLDEFGTDGEKDVNDFLVSSIDEIREMFDSGWGIPYETDHYFEPVRADGRVFSYVVSHHTYLAGAHGFMDFTGYNIDPATGEEIAFSDVVKSTDELPEIIVQELIKQNDDLADYFEELKSDRENLVSGIPDRLKDNAKGLAWAVDYDGLVVNFEDYAMGSYAAGARSVKIKFADYPQIFTDKFDNYKDKVPVISDIARELKAADKVTIDAGEASASTRSVSVSLKTSDEIKAYLAGDWTLVNRDSGEDFATLSFENDGTLTYTRLKDGASCTGTIEFERNSVEGEIPDKYSLKMNKLDAFMGDQGSMSSADTAETDGIFHIGIGGGTDYLYLSEIGNGDTLISRNDFNIYEPDDYDHWTNEWLFVRNNNEKSLEPLKYLEFYAFAWGRGSGGSVLLQNMKACEFDSIEDYTNRAFRAAYFGDDSECSVREYELSETAKTYTFLNEEKFENRPLYVYKVTTDSDGKISQIMEVDSAFYGMYDLGSLDPDFYVDGTTFYYNGTSYSLSEIAPAANAITNSIRVGDFIILECHVNPHIGCYEFFNIYSGDFNYEITGTNLIWKNDDLSTAVYSQYNQIYDFWGNLIGSVMEGEVYNLTFSGDNEVIADCWKVDGETESEFTESFECEHIDGAMYSYFRFLLGMNKCSLWREFREQATENAGAFVIVNAPNMIYDRISRPFIYKEGALDVIAVVPLSDGEKVHIESAEPDASGNADRDEEHEPTKRNPIQYSITVPEGMPYNNLIVRDEKGRELIWPICQISGRVPQRSTFLEY